MLYLIINCSAWAFILVVFGCLCYYDRVSWQKMSTQTITICALLIAVACVLTNVISYKIPLFNGIRLDFGLFLIFLVGICFGPLWGFCAGVIADSLGALIGLGGVYFALFTVNKALFGFAGGLVFLKGHKYKQWMMTSVGLYSVMFLIMSFGFDQIYLWVVFGNVSQAIWIIKLIKFPIELIFWNIIIILSAQVMLHLTVQHFHGYLWWCRANEKQKPKIEQKPALTWRWLKKPKEYQDDFTH